MAAHKKAGPTVRELSGRAPEDPDVVARRNRRYRERLNQHRAKLMVEGKRKAAKEAAKREAMNAADRADAIRRAAEAHENDPRVVAYREAKAERAKRQAPLMADAATAFARELQRVADAQKGGRPRTKGNSGTVRGRKSYDPADALVRALRPQDEGAW